MTKPRPGQLIAIAQDHMAGIGGALCLILETRRGISPSLCQEWASRLRKAADALDQIGDAHGKKES